MKPLKQSKSSQLAALSRRSSFSKPVETKLKSPRIATMFDKEKEFADLNKGSKATIFDRKCGVGIKNVRGKFTVIKYTVFE